MNHSEDRRGDRFERIQHARRQLLRYLASSPLLAANPGAGALSALAATLSAGALALGATAVGIGRPYCWGLAAFGQPGVEAVLSILQREFETIMRQAGTRSLGLIGSDALVG